MPQSSYLPDISTNWNDGHESLKSSCDGGGSVYERSYTIPEQFSQEELSDLIRDLNLSKNASEILGSRRKDKNSFCIGTKVAFYRSRERELLPYFCLKDELVHCKHFEGLLLKMGVPECRYQDWRMFISSSKRSLKCIWLHNGNHYVSVPIGHSSKLLQKNITILNEYWKN